MMMIMMMMTVIIIITAELLTLNLFKDRLSYKLHATILGKVHCHIIRDRKIRQWYSMSKR